MDLVLVLRQRLKQLGLEQRDLATAARVTESNISQLLPRKKAPPASGRRDIYDKMGELLGFPKGQIARIADFQRQQAIKKEWVTSPVPLFKEVRELVLRKCHPDKAKPIRAIFEQQSFGELERLVTQELLDVVKEVAKQELKNEKWLRRVVQLSKRSYEQTRVSTILEFLDADVFNV